MQKLIFKRSSFLFISFILILGATTLMAQEKIKVAGTMTCAVTKQEVINVGDIEGHIITLGEQEGTNVSTGKNDFMNNAQVMNMSFNDVINGSGTHHTYTKVSKKDNMLISKSEGKSTMTLSNDGTPLITVEGTFSWIKGTGQFENIQGKGTYKGKYISRTIWVLDWQGEYFIKK